MSRPHSITAAAGLAGLTAALTALLWNATDFTSVAVVASPPPPGPPDGVSSEEWERVLTTPSPGPDPEPLTNLELFGLLFHWGLIALALTVIVLWLVVAVAAARSRGWVRFVALAVAAGQAMMLLSLGAGIAPLAYVVIVSGAISAVLLWRPESIAHFVTAEPQHS